MQHAGDGLVEQLQVVRDEQHGTLVAAQVVHQPEGGWAVEVVGRLVQQQQIVRGEERAREGEPRLLAARERGDGALQLDIVQREALKQLGHLVFGGVASRALEAFLQLAIAIEQPLQRISRHGAAALAPAVGAGARRLGDWLGRLGLGHLRFEGAEVGAEAGEVAPGEHDIAHGDGFAIAIGARRAGRRPGAPAPDSQSAWGGE